MEIIFDLLLIVFKQNIFCVEEVIELVGLLFVRCQICSVEYVNEMLMVYEDFGVVIVIDDGIVMLYVWLEKGVLQIGFLFVIIVMLIFFGYDEFDLVFVVIVIVGVDVDSYIKMI